MRAVVQRVTEGDVTVDGNVTGAIRNGLVVLLGVAEDDICLLYTSAKQCPRRR